MRFASPWYLLLLAPVAALIWLELRKRTSAVRFSDVSFLRTHRGAGRHLKPVLIAANAVVISSRSLSPSYSWMSHVAAPSASPICRTIVAMTSSSTMLDANRAAVLTISAAGRAWIP